jgi:hypothetical protein
VVLFDLSHRHIGLKFKEETIDVVLLSIVLYGAETWALGKVYRKYLASFEVWYWIKMEKTSWRDLVRNEVLRSVLEESSKT